MSPGNLPIKGILFPTMKTIPITTSKSPIKINNFPKSATTNISRLI